VVNINIRNKRGIELALQTIVVAILLLIVLVVMIFIFTDMVKSNVIIYKNITDSQITGDCRDISHMNYQCVPQSECCDGCLKWAPDPDRTGQFDCSADEKCCKKKEDKLI
jgi:hypothetical protein